MNLDTIHNAVLIWGSISAEGLDFLKQEKALAIVPEQRPYLLGIKRNIPLLQKAGIEFVYCSDNALGLLFYKNKIKKTVLFYQERNGNTIWALPGSLYVNILSQLHKVPVCMLAQGTCDFSLLDRDASTVENKNFVCAKNKENSIVSVEREVLIL